MFKMDLTFNMPSKSSANDLAWYYAKNSYNRVINVKYSFDENSSHRLINKPYLLFTFGNQELDVSVLTRDELEELCKETLEKTPIEADVVAEFLGLLGNKWMLFLFNELGYHKKHFIHFAWLDLVDTIEDILPQSISGSKMALSRSVMIENKLLTTWSDLKQFEKPDVEIGKIRSAILEMCEHKFKELFRSMHPEKAKQQIILQFATESDDGATSDQNSGSLVNENQLLLAQHLINIDRMRLIDKMKSAVKRYQIKESSMSDELMESLNLQICAGDDMEF